MTDHGFPAPESTPAGGAGGDEAHRERAPAIELLLVPAPAPGSRAAAGTDADAYASRASILERLVGEGRRHREGLRSLELAWLGRPGREPAMLLAARTSTTDATGAASAHRNLRADVVGALADHSPLDWRPARARPAKALAAFRPTHAARLHLAVPTAGAVEVYPLRASTVERALRRVRVPVLVTVKVLVMPRRRPLRAGADGSEPGPWTRAVSTRGDGTAPDPTGRRGRAQDPAERWRYLVRVEVASSGDLPRDVLAAVASDIRGAGSRSVGIILAGAAASVDAEWRLVEPGTDRGTDPGADRWPDDTASLNLREAACLLALPGGDDAAEPSLDRLARVPDRLPRRGIVVGTVAGVSRPVAIPPDDFLRHLFVLGATGSGKSTALLHLVDQAARDPARPAVLVLDPHATLATKAMGTLPESERHRVVLFDPADPVAPMTWNPLLAATPEERAAVVDAFIAWAWEMWDPAHTMQAGMGPIAEQGLRAVLQTVMAVPGSTLADAYDLLADDDLAERYLPHLADGPTRRYWAMRGRMAAKDKSDLAAYLTSKLAPFAQDARLRRVLSPERSTLDLRGALAAGQIVLVSVRKADMGSQATEMLLRLLKRFLWREITARGADVSGQRRVVVVIDEFTNYPSELDEVILQEARKFGTSLVLATQNLGQARRSVVESVAANASSLVAYRVGLPDSAAVAAMLGDPSIAFELTRLRNFRAVARVPVRGEPLPPVLIDSPKPVRGFSQATADAVRAMSRAAYGVPVPPAGDAAAGDAEPGTSRPGRSRPGAGADPGGPRAIGDASGLCDVLSRAGVRAAVDADGDVRIDHPAGTVYATVRDGVVRLWLALRVRARRSRVARLDLVSRINATVPVLRAALRPGSDAGAATASLVLEWSMPGDVPYPDAVMASAVDRFVRAVVAALELDTDDVLR